MFWAIGIVMFLYWQKILILCVVLAGQYVLG